MQGGKYTLIAVCNHVKRRAQRRWRWEVQIIFTRLTNAYAVNENLFPTSNLHRDRVPYAVRGGCRCEVVYKPYSCMLYGWEWRGDQPLWTLWGCKFGLMASSCKLLWEIYTGFTGFYSFWRHEFPIKPRHLSSLSFPWRNTTPRSEQPYTFWCEYCSKLLPPQRDLIISRGCNLSRSQALILDLNKIPYSQRDAQEDKERRGKETAKITPIFSALNLGKSCPYYRGGRSWSAISGQPNYSGRIATRPWTRAQGQ